MSGAAQMTNPADTSMDAAESQKRKDILEGARAIFRAEGFDGASMGKIAAAAKVSKGTLYVYFDSKETLFRELVIADRKDAAERIFRIEPEEESDFVEALTELGIRFVSSMLSRDHIALIRMVMGASEKFPEVGQEFFRTGPCYGINRLADCLRQQVAAGELQIDDELELAAAHFLNLCQGNLAKQALFGIRDVPTPDEIRRTVDSAVRIFMRAYGKTA